ncbi:thiamine-phosphate kinase [Thiomicrorhabdus sp. ZW0627]|uniref:thiamine-phosphate kinase n=1 Tax=Thiomicrorhabdus sp. ZW0627 TaxID=3039774 RepID=UPI002436FEFC|nr:thiamine-phosphate kinase [Thiomicrorhabdus sp. ZW0627]MDG6773208.1 thiamine-phosphate kinase [Thiomicrorhabdus sp. ZW0627]
MSEEFNLIDRYFLPLSQNLSADEVGIGDDGAVLTPPENHQLVVVTDTLVAGVHFPLETSAYDVAWKALAVNLSDLAAMGAIPGSFTLALTLPENDPAWLESFSLGLAELSRLYRISLVGGDTTKGPLTVTVTANGWVEKGRAILRSGADEGDLICASGCLGDAGLGLKVAMRTFEGNQQACLSKADMESCLEALNRPKPQLDLGRQLTDFASAAIDVSDGLLADLGHILEKSSAKTGRVLGAELYLDQVPISEAMRKWIDETGDWSLPLSAGDDYQLCFTVREKDWEALSTRLVGLQMDVKPIGRIQSVQGVQIKETEGGEVLSDVLSIINGYQHF